MFHCTICNHRTPEECSLECTCCCSIMSDEYYRFDDDEFFGSSENDGVSHK